MRRLALLAALLATPLAGCSSPPVDLYTLAAVPGASGTGAPVPGKATHRQAGPRSVELRRIGLAGYLDRPEIVRSTTGYRLQVSDRERWGEPLGGMIGRVFTEDLLQRLPGTAVYSDTGAITARPDRVLEVDIQRFDVDAAGAVVLVAQVGVRHDDGSTVAAADTLRISVQPGGSGTPALVAAMSAALGQLADQVASRLATT